MAHKKGQGSSRNGRDSNGQRRGVKRYAGQAVKSGSILIRQCGTKIPPGQRDDQLEALLNSERLIVPLVVIVIISSCCHNSLKAKSSVLAPEAQQLRCLLTVLLSSFEVETGVRGVSASGVKSTFPAADPTVGTVAKEARCDFAPRRELIVSPHLQIENTGMQNPVRTDKENLVTDEMDRILPLKSLREPVFVTVTRGIQFVT